MKGINFFFKETAFAIFFFHLVFSQDVLSAKSLHQKPGSCGVYKIFGIFRESQDLQLVGFTNEDSFSRVKLIPWKKEWLKVAGFLNMPISFQAKVMKMNQREVYIKDIQDISYRAENPLNPLENQGFFILRKSNCEAE